MTRARSIANIGAAVDSGLSWRNRLINGGFQVRQRGSIAATSGVQYGPDRWIGAISGGTSISATFNASSFGGALSGLGAFLAGSWTNGQPYFAQRIEAANVIDLNAGQITVSGKFFQDTGNSQNIVVRISKPTATDNWSGSTVVATSANILIPSGATTPFSATFTLGATDASGGLMVEVYLANAITVTSKNIGIADMQLEAGSVATPFERRDYGRELIMCQRYLPAAIGAGLSIWGSAANANQAVVTVPFQVQPRTAPTGMTVSAISDFNVSDVVSQNATATAIAISSAGLNTGTLIVGCTALTTARPTYLFSNNANAKLLFTGCEL